MEQIKTNLYYLNDRSYIDVSTISSCFAQSLSLENYSEHVNAEAIHIKNPIKFNGLLKPGQLKNYDVLFKCRYKNDSYIYSFIQETEAISSRKPEPSYKIEEHLTLEGQKAKVRSAITTSMTYNLMVFGKALIQNNTSKVPRVVQTDLSSNLNKSDYQNLYIEFNFLKNNFASLTTFINQKKHGLVIVKLL